MTLIGYARVSTGDQNLGPQLDGLRAAGCSRIFEEHASGGMRTRPQLAQALATVGKGDTLLVARIDRLARSLSHLLEIVETLRARRAFSLARRSHRHDRPQRATSSSTPGYDDLAVATTEHVVNFPPAGVHQCTEASIPDRLTALARKLPSA